MHKTKAYGTQEDKTGKATDFFSGVGALPLLAIFTCGVPGD